jgi:hypothetical protein
MSEICQFGDKRLPMVLSANCLPLCLQGIAVAASFVQRGG